jgi:methionyl-tRNA synthetase
MKDRLDMRLGALEFHRAIEEIWRVVELGNQYIERSAPWKLAKDHTKKETLENVLCTQMEILYWLTLFFYPFMPQTAEAMAKQLGITIHFSNPLLGTTRWGAFPSGTTVAKGKPLFPRIETQPTQPEPVVLADPAGTSEVPLIGIEDFLKVQLKIGNVVAAEAVPKSKKLLKLRVDIGTETRQIVAGIATKYAPEEIIGKRVVIVANLKPAKLMGVESQGMVLAAGDREVEGLLSVLESVEAGTKVK